MTSRNIPPGWWGGFGRGGASRLTMLDLLKNHTLDLDTAALLWLLVEKKASIIVGAGPMMAGKTTLLTSILDLAPPWYEKVYTRGQAEDFSWLPQADPSKTYILAPELSPHTPHYLWGDGARTLFKAASQGFSIAATMHADTPQEVIAMLEGYPLYIPPEQLSRLDVVVNLRLMYGRNDYMRRVSQVCVAYQGDFVAVVRWDPREDAFTRNSTARAAYALESVLGYGAGQLESDIKQKSDTLHSWASMANVSPDDLYKLVDGYYEGMNT